MEGKVSKDTWNMIRQISITGRRSWKALKVFPILPCSEALSSDQAANLLGERQNCRLFSPRVTQEKQVVLCQSGQTSRKKAALQICSYRKRSQQTAFPSATGFQRNGSQTVKWKNLLLPCNLCNQVMQSDWLPQMLAVSLPSNSCCLH